MLFTRIFTAAALVVCAVAQGKLQFTQAPSNVEVGKPVTIKWSGGDGSPVTITLKKGQPKDLKSVEIITGSAKGNTFTWTPKEDLTDGEDYALSIAQGVGGDDNYTGQFSISGGSGSSSATSSDASASTATTTVMSSGTTSVTSTVYETGVSTGIVTMSRNGTMVSPTLSRTGGISAGSATRTSASATGTGSGSSSTNAASNLQAQVVLGAGAFAAAILAL